MLTGVSTCLYDICNNLKLNKVSEVEAKKSFHHMVNSEVKFLVICEVNEL